MKTLRLSTEKMSLDEICKTCAGLFQAGQLVAFPTETVYGLGGNGLDASASTAIYTAKGRPSDNPLILHIGRKEQLYPLVSEVPETAEKLMRAFWPGPLTMILPKADCVPLTTSGGLSTVAIRMPSHKVANAILQAVDFPIAAPSANRSGRPSPTNGDHVYEDMNGRIAAIVDDGDVGIGVESTIVDLTGEKPMILRPGYITKEMLEEAVGEVLIDPALMKLAEHDASIFRQTDFHPKAPGMKYRHYAPKAPVCIVAGEENQVIQAINSVANRKTGIITVEEHKNAYIKGQVLVVGKQGDIESIAHNLFAVLRKFDSLDVNKIYSEDFTDIDHGGAVMNRLLKAAGGNYLQAEEIK